MEIHVLKKWRTQQGLTQYALAKRVGCAHQLISRIERGETKPSIHTAKRLEAAVGGAYAWHEIMDSEGEAA